jgi:CheY-like chemotaxis protein
VSDSPEGGALFSVHLPRRAPPGVLVQPAVGAPPAQTISPARGAVAQLSASASAAWSGPSEPAGSGGVVLIVEDNPEMAELIQDTLGPDYRTIPASNGMEGLDKARHMNPDLILTDLMMPEMSGEEFLHEVRAEREFDRVPVVVLTARADEHVRVHLLREGAQDRGLRSELSCAVSMFASGLGTTALALPPKITSVSSTCSSGSMANANTPARGWDWRSYGRPSSAWGDQLGWSLPWARGAGSGSS